MNTYPTDSNPFLDKKDKPASNKGKGIELTVDSHKVGVNANTDPLSTGTGFIKDGASSGYNAAKDAGAAGYHSAQQGAAAGYSYAAAGAELGAGYAMDAAKVAKLDDAKAFMNPEFTNYLSMDYTKFMDIIPIDYYGPVEKLLLSFFLYLPAFFCFYTLKMFHDSIYTMVILSVFVFVGLTFFHYKMMDEKLWYFIALKNFTTEYKEKIKAAVIQGLGAGVGLALILILWFTFIPWGPKAIYLQMPYFQNWWDVVYWAFFTVFFLAVLPAAESVFYFVFQNNVWFKASAKINISIAYALYHFGWICEVVDNWWAIIILTILAFVVGILCLSLSTRENIFRGITFRVGLGLAVYALLIWLYFMHPKGKVVIPGIFLRGSANNMFMKK